MRKVPTNRPLTTEEMAQLDALTGAPDTVDISPAPEANWATARRGILFRYSKESISVRLDMDVLDWLRRQGPGYQTTINRLLRERMEAETTR